MIDLKSRLDHRTVRGLNGKKPGRLRNPESALFVEASPQGNDVLARATCSTR